MARRRTKRSRPKRMSVQDFVKYLMQNDTLNNSLVYRHRIKGKDSDFASPQQPLTPQVLKALHSLGIQQLYSHQTASIDLVRQGRNVVLVTPTASGKSLAFNIPVIESLLKDPNAKALYLFPLKALEQDQFGRLKEFLEQMGDQHGLDCAVYDGDTPKAERARIKKKLPRILITNPDMLHHGIMPFHTRWEELFRTLKYVVIDELHTYRGVFGSHILQIFRRMKRLSEFYNVNLQFIAASATIENPLELAESLLGVPFSLIDKSGAPNAARHFLFFNPLHSPYTEAARIFAECINAGLKTITFTRSRKITELLYTWCTQSNKWMKNRVAAYRAGFLPEERRIIEQRLFAEELDGVISTSALEMGIDIGGLDACILVGYPGTITATWQRSGRVGRKDRESMVALIAGPDALDQYFISHPQELFERPCERAVVDGDNSEILRAHLVCAAAEIPIRAGERVIDVEKYRRDLDALVAQKRLDQSASGKQWFAIKALPHHQMDIRSMGTAFTITTSEKKIIGVVSGRQRFAECHTGAIYLHGGKQYHIRAVDEARRTIRAVEVNSEYFTVPVSEKETEILEHHRSTSIRNFTVNQGRLKVTERITGYQRKRLLGQELIDQVALDFPPLTFETIGIWIEIEEEIRDILRTVGRHYMGSLHGIEHAALSLFPLFALCDRNDVGGICKPHHAQVNKGVIFLYDGHSGGVGLAARAYEVIDALLERTLKLIEACDCELGCPSCIHSPKCGSGNKPLDKIGSKLTLKILLGHDVQLLLEQLLKEYEQSGGGFVESENNGSPQQVNHHQGKRMSTAKIEILPHWDTPGAPGIVHFEKKYRIVCFDLETQKSSNDVGGWGNAHLMRVSVGVVYDSTSDSFHTYTEQDIEALIEHLRAAHLVVGFNSIQFDYQVLKGYDPFNFSRLPSFDICSLVHKAAGKRYSLNLLARGTLNEKKSGDGLQALQWFKQGRIEKITEYCKDDVRITRDLFRFGVTHHFLCAQSPKSSDFEKFSVPFEHEVIKLIES